MVVVRVLFSGFKFYNRSSGVWYSSIPSELSNDFTVIASFSWEFSRKVSHILVATRPWFASPDGWIFFISGGEEAGNINLNIDQGGTWYSLGTGNRPVKFNTPYVVAFTYSNGNVKIYANGERILEDTFPLGTLSYGSYNMTIGNNLYYYPFMGIIGSVLIYSRVLTDDEIRAISESINTPDRKGLLIWHIFGKYGAKNIASVTDQYANYRNVAQVGFTKEIQPLNVKEDVSLLDIAMHLSDINIGVL